MWVFSNIYCPLKLKYAYNIMYFYSNPFSVRPRFLRYTIILQCTRIYICMYTCFRCVRNRYYANSFLPSFAED